MAACTYFNKRQATRSEATRRQGDCFSDFHVAKDCYPHHRASTQFWPNDSLVEVIQQRKVTAPAFGEVERCLKLKVDELK